MCWRWEQWAESGDPTIFAVFTNNAGDDGFEASPAAHALIGVTIDHQEPLHLRLCRAMRGSRLSIREQGVCLALADNLSYPAIAARLHLSPSTVVTYIRRIHEKLGTNSREELLKALLASIQ